MNHFINILDLTEKEIELIYELADRLKLEKEQKQLLKGKTIILFFPETSIRTRVTFEKGIKMLGGDCSLFPPNTLDKRERIEDVIGYLKNFADAVVIRHSDYSKVEEFVKHSNIPIINAMTSFNHPCEIITDFYSIAKLRKDYHSLCYTFVGEGSNISRSWMHLAKVMNLDFHHVCIPGQNLKKDDANYKFHTSFDSILEKTDVLLTDSLPSELKTESYLQDYQITLERLRQAKPNVLLNPCPPFYRNEEISEAALNSGHFVGYGFKKNLIYVQQAIMLLCMYQNTKIEEGFV